LTDGRACPFAVRLFYATVFVAPICTVVSGRPSTEHRVVPELYVYREHWQDDWLGPSREHWKADWG